MPCIAVHAFHLPVMSIQQSLGGDLAGGDNHGVGPQHGDAPVIRVLGSFRRRAYLGARPDPAALAMMAYCTTAPSSMTAPGMTTE